MSRRSSLALLAASAAVLARGAHAAAARPPKPALPFEPHVAVELRLGVQTATLPWPAVGGLVCVTMPRHLDLIVGYELVRVWDEHIRLGPDSAGAPIVLSAIRAGLGRRWVNMNGRFVRAAVLGGVATTATSLVQAPGGLGGAVGELSADLSAGLTGGAGRIALFATPTVSWGRVTNEFGGPAGTQTASVAIRSLSLAIGFSLALHI